MAACCRGESRIIWNDFSLASHSSTAVFSLGFRRESVSRKIYDLDVVVIQRIETPEQPHPGSRFIYPENFHMLKMPQPIQHRLRHIV
jgi:hypothetical protein